MNVLFHFGAGPELTARFEPLDEQGIFVTACDETDTAELMRVLPGIDVLWHVLEPATAAMMAAAPKLRLIQKIGVGVNTIDLEAARVRGIAVCNLPGTNARAVAELTLLLMLAALRRLPMFHGATRAGNGFALDPGLRDNLGELGGRTVGLVGYGAVPQALAPVLRALGSGVIYTARAPHEGVPGFRTLDRLLAEADVVSLHVPLTDETKGLINAAALRQMREGAILVNTARGGLVDSPAVAQALLGGRLAAAGFDVFAEEPPPPGDPLLIAPNVVLTPHIGWLTTGTFDRSFALAAENCRRLAAGRELLHRVV